MKKPISLSAITGDTFIDDLPDRGRCLTNFITPETLISQEEAAELLKKALLEFLPHFLVPLEMQVVLMLGGLTEEGVYTVQEAAEKLCKESGNPFSQQDVFCIYESARAKLGQMDPQLACRCYEKILASGQVPQNQHHLM